MHFIIVDIGRVIEGDLLKVDTYDQLIGINRKIIEIQEGMNILSTTSWWKSDSEKDLKDNWKLKYKSIISAYKKVKKDEGGFLQFSDYMEQLENSKIENSNTEN